MFFEIGSLKISQYSQENTCVGVSLKRDSNTGASGGYYKIFKNSFFYRTPLVATSDSPTTVQ